MLWDKQFCSWSRHNLTIRVTDTYYHNKRGNNPIFIGSTLFLFTKDDKAFTRLALELPDREPELINLETIGADMEEAIAKEIKKNSKY